MADQVTVDNGTLADYDVSSDDCTPNGQVQRVKLAYSADGVATHVTADANGLLVTGPLTDAQLRATPVPVSGTVTVGTMAALVAGAANIGDVDVLTIAAGDNNIGNVDIVTMPAITGTGTLAVQVDGAALTALQLIDDPVQVLGTDTYTEATSKGVTLGAVRRDADTTLVGITNEFSPLQVDANGRLKVEAFSGETLPVSLTSTTITGSVDTELPTAAAISAENTAAPTAPSIYNFPLLFDGTNWDRSPGNSTDGTLVNLGANNDVTVTGTVTANLAAGTNTNEVVGDAAHDAGIAGNPVRVGGRGLTADYTAVATGDTTDAITTILGKIVTKPFALPGQQWNYAAAAGGITNTTAVTIKAAGAAGVRNYLTDLQVINGHATVATEVLIRDGAAGATIHRGYAAAAGGGYSIAFGSPLRGTAATLLEVVCITTGSAIYVNANGYEAAE